MISMKLTTIYNNSNNFRWEILFYLKALLHYPKHDIKKFIIFAQGRSGSSLLVDLLNNHPDIKCDGEILNVVHAGKKFFPIFYVKSKAKTYKEEIYGFKVKLYQLHGDSKPDQNIDPKKFILNLYKSGWKIIYLRRHNIFRQAISGYVAKSRGKWHHQTNKGELALSKIKINPDRLLKRLRAREKYLCDEKEILKTIPHLEIIYEENLLKDMEKTMDKIFKYLEVHPYPVRTNLIRTSKDTLQDYIVNYKEIKDYFLNTKYARFF